MGSIGDNLYRLHQPAAALAQLEGVEVVRCILRPVTTTGPRWRPMWWCSR